MYLLGLPAVALRDGSSASKQSLDADVFVGFRPVNALAIAQKTYFQKIADPADIAPTAGVAFSINHVAAVGIPVVFGFIWLQSSAAVFLIGAGMAAVSLALSMLIPHDPQAGNETVLRGTNGKLAVPAE